MRKVVTAVALSVFAMVAHAEASFDQIEGLIQQKNYAAAEAGLEVIVKNHPQSAKAFYAMAQAQAGLGNLEKAQKALNIATGLNPTLDFAPEGSVRKLKEAITPQEAKIEAVEETHFWRNTFLFLLVVGAGIGGMILAAKHAKKKQEEAEEEILKAKRERERAELAEQIKQSSNAAKAKASIATEPKTDNTPKYTASPAYSTPVQQPLYTPQPTHTTVVNNSNDGLLTGILIGDMLNSHNHETTRVVEREVIREVPAPKRDTSWDDTPSRSSSRSSSWDDTPSTSSSRSSSWDSDSSSSSSSSSWSSSSDDSSSSWSSSDSGSSSSWD